MKQIFKYPIIGHGITRLEVPGTGKVLSVGLDLKGVLCVWIQVSAKQGESMTPIILHTLFTGEEFVATSLTFVGTVGFASALIVHVFQEK